MCPLNEITTVMRNSLILAHVTVHLEKFINSEALLFMVFTRKHGAALLHILEEEPLICVTKAKYFLILLGEIRQVHLGCILGLHR